MSTPTNKPRVLHVITGMTVGGAQTLLLDLLPVLAEDFEVELACLYPGILRGEMERLGIRVHELDHRHLFSPSTLRGLKKIMRQFRPQIVHTHLGRADLYGRVAARMTGGAAIFTHSHNIDDWKKRALFNALDNFTMRWNHTVYAVSDKVRDFLISRGAPAAKIKSLYNGINIESRRRRPAGFDRAVWRAQFGIGPDDKLLTHIGRQDIQKAHTRLIAGFDEFAARHPEWKLLCVGGEGRVKEEVAAAAAKAARASGRIIFAGHRRDIAEIMAATDVFILPSLWEGHPIVLLEAMANAKPIIATAVGGVPEMLEDGKSAILIPPDDVEKITGAMERMAANPAAAAEMGRQAREIVEARFDIRVMARAIAADYRAALGSR